MDSKKFRQITKALEKAFQDWDYAKAINASNDESTTRDFLVHPFFELLGYARMDDFTHEYIADVGGKRGRRVDIAITLGKGSPQILVECKRVGTSFTDNHFRQLNEYVNYTPSAKFGILTDGVKYDFYARDNNSGTGLHSSPFFSFNLEDYDSADVESLSLFYRPTIELKAITEEAEEIMFLSRFDKALVDVLTECPDGFVKEIAYRMGAKRVSDQMKAQIADLVNSMSLKSALDGIRAKESASSSTGIVTTEQELKAYNIIRTVLAMSSKIKNDDMTRIGFRDYKGHFSLMVDDNQRKKICSLDLDSREMTMEINGLTHVLEEVSSVCITKHKKALVEAAVSALYE